MRRMPAGPNQLALWSRAELVNVRQKLVRARAAEPTGHPGSRRPWAGHVRKTVTAVVGCLRLLAGKFRSARSAVLLPLISANRPV